MNEKGSQKRYPKVNRDQIPDHRERKKPGPIYFRYIKFKHKNRNDLSLRNRGELIHVFYAKQRRMQSGDAQEEPSRRRVKLGVGLLTNFSRGEKKKGAVWNQRRENAFQRTWGEKPKCSQNTGKNQRFYLLRKNDQTCQNGTHTGKVKAEVEDGEQMGGRN